MKIFKMFLTATIITGITFNLVANENVPMITDGAIDLEQYLFGDVDSNGQTILHKFAENCDNNDFIVKFRLFDFLENFEKSESFKSLQVKMALCNMMPQDAVQAFVIIEANNFVQKKDNNGRTALDIAKNRNALNPHKRCTSCVEFLNLFDELNRQLKK